MKPKWFKTDAEIEAGRKAMAQARLEIQQRRWRQLYAPPDPFAERMRRLAGHDTAFEAAHASNQDWQERWEDETLISL